MHFKVDDVRIREIKELAPPALLLREFPCSEKTEELTYNTRQAIHRLLHGSDDRVLVIIGPCSMHDPKAGLEYARRLVEMKNELERDLVIVMRSEEHTSELQSQSNLVCRLLLEKKK